MHCRHIARKQHFIKRTIAVFFSLCILSAQTCSVELRISHNSSGPKLIFSVPCADGKINFLSESPNTFRFTTTAPPLKTDTCLTTFVSGEAIISLVDLFSCISNDSIHFDTRSMHMELNSVYRVCDQHCVLSVQMSDLGTYFVSSWPLLSEINALLSENSQKTTLDNEPAVIDPGLHTIEDFHWIYSGCNEENQYTAYFQLCGKFPPSWNETFLFSSSSSSSSSLSFGGTRDSLQSTHERAYFMSLKRIIPPPSTVDEDKNIEQIINNGLDGDGKECSIWGATIVSAVSARHGRILGSQTFHSSISIAYDLANSCFNDGASGKKSLELSRRLVADIQMVTESNHSVLLFSNFDDGHAHCNEYQLRVETIYFGTPSIAPRGCNSRSEGQDLSVIVWERSLNPLHSALIRIQENYMQCGTRVRVDWQRGLEREAAGRDGCHATMCIRWSIVSLRAPSSSLSSSNTHMNGKNNDNFESENIYFRSTNQHAGRFTRHNAQLFERLLQGSDASPEILHSQRQQHKKEEEQQKTQKRVFFVRQRAVKGHLQEWRTRNDPGKNSKKSQTQVRSTEWQGESSISVHSVCTEHYHHIPTLGYCVRDYDHDIYTDFVFWIFSLSTLCLVFCCCCQLAFHRLKNAMRQRKILFGAKKLQSYHQQPIFALSNATHAK